MTATSSSASSVSTPSTAIAPATWQQTDFLRNPPHKFKYNLST